MRTPSELRALLQEGTARLRDGQVGGNPREFLQKLRMQLQCDVPADTELSIVGLAAALDTRLDSQTSEPFISNRLGSRLV